MNNNSVKVGDIIHMDDRTNAWFIKNPGSRTTVTQCEKCELWYKPDLGHECKKENKNG